MSTNVAQLRRNMNVRPFLLFAQLLEKHDPGIGKRMAGQRRKADYLSWELVTVFCLCFLLREHRAEKWNFVKSIESLRFRDELGCWWVCSFDAYLRRWSK